VTLVSLEWRDVFSIIADFPRTGTGLGSFEQVAPLYEHYFNTRYWILQHAHNDWLELLATGGVPALVLAGCGVLTVLTTALVRLRTRRDQRAALLGAAAFCAVILTLLHSLVDFILYCPANRVYFFFFCGLAIAASHSALSRRRAQTLLRPVSCVPFRLAIALLAPLMALTVWTWGGPLFTAKEAEKLRNMYINPQMSVTRHCAALNPG